MKRTPVAIFVYNRPDKTTRILESLLKCDQREACEIHIFCDGAKNEAQLAQVMAVRHIAREWISQHGGVMVERDANLGLAQSIASGVSDLCETHGRVIVIEDDLLLSPDFLVFMLAGLEHYAAAEQVMQISGYIYPIEHTGVNGAFFLPLTTAWGWATWQRAWQYFDLKPQGVTEFLAQPDKREQFTLGGAYHYDQMLEHTLAGEIDTWDIQWWYIVFRAGGLVLYPEKSLVLNTGFDKSGVNTTGGLNPSYSARQSDMLKVRLKRPLIFPKTIAANSLMLARVRDYLRQWQTGNIVLKPVRQRGYWLWRLLRRLIPGCHY